MSLYCLPVCFAPSVRHSYRRSWRFLAAPWLFLAKRGYPHPPLLVSRKFGKCNFPLTPQDPLTTPHSSIQVKPSPTPSPSACSSSPLDASHSLPVNSHLFSAAHSLRPLGTVVFCIGEDGHDSSQETFHDSKQLDSKIIHDRSTNGEPSSIEPAVESASPSTPFPRRIRCASCYRQPSN